MDHFELPVIPKIYIPQNIPQSNPPNKPSNEDIVSKNELNSSESEVYKEDTKIDSTSEASPRQLCESCSQILLSYFMPLQQYVNEVVHLARGERGLPSNPLFNLLNTQSIKSQIENSSSEKRNDGNYSEGHSFQPVDREVGHFNNESQGNGQRISQYSRDEPNSHQNQRPDQNSNYTQNQGFHKTDDYTQNVNQNQNQNSTQTNFSSNVSQPEDQNVVPNPSPVHREQSQDHPIHTTSGHTDNESREQSNVESHSGGDRVETNVYKQSYDSNTNEGPTQRSSYQNAIESHESSKQESASVEASGVEEDNSVVLSSPYAFVTIAYNNLSATNAIILANSLVLTNNRSMNMRDKYGNKSTCQLPFIILIGGNIDPVLKDAIYMVFDEVISQPMDVKVALLSDHSFGIRQFKLQLWKELQNYQKCLYLESSTLVVGRVTNLFEECQELSACVDWLFPDNFNCSVFVFEPSLTTYDQIISFALFHQRCSAQKDEGIAETLDEMTLLNQFFAPKWNRISFIYNFVKNESIYTQIPAFMKYGDSIRIVNFGHMMSQTGIMSPQPGMSSVQPWHILFDLLTCSQQDVIKTMPIDNYSKFYLNCFIQRLWPILQTHLTPLLVTKYGVGRREWSIFDLIRLLTNESGIETDDHMFTQTPITFRRIKSTAETISKYDSLSVDDEDDYLSERMPILSIDDNDLNNGLNTNQIEGEDGVVKEETQISEPKLSVEQQDERSKSEWEAGRIDWMGAHQSDRIINRLKKLIRND